METKLCFHFSFSQCVIAYSPLSFSAPLCYNRIGDDMTILEIIEKKKNAGILSKEEIDFWIEGMIKEEIPDYQTSALLMAIVLNGMSQEETLFLTDAMLRSGEKIDLSDVDGVKVDKHSTGGVGDKITLILAPLLATFGLKVAKMSGRGLGHTGGTIDKLESIPGYQVELSREDFIEQVNTVGVSVISQSGNLVPADKKLYALRDVTATVQSIPLIASSIMSKKIASGADLIAIDVKVGNGALMKTVKEAKELANTMIEIGNYYHKKVICVLTNMDEPLGYAIGNSLEVEEAINTLKGMGPEDVMELVIKLTSLIVSSVSDRSKEEVEQQCFKMFNTGLAYQKFEQLVVAQGGNLQHLPSSTRVFSVRSAKAGYIAHIDSLKLGEIARKIGAGRFTKEDIIHYQVGLVLSHKVGDFVEINEELVKVYLDDLDVRVNDILDCFVIQDAEVEKLPLIYEVIC